MTRHPLAVTKRLSLVGNIKDTCLLLVWLGGVKLATVIYSKTAGAWRAWGRLLEIHFAKPLNHVKVFKHRKHSERPRFILQPVFSCTGWCDECIAPCVGGWIFEEVSLSLEPLLKETADFFFLMPFTLSRETVTSPGIGLLAGVTGADRQHF